MKSFNEAVDAEVARQIELHGKHVLPNGTSAANKILEDAAREDCEQAFDEGRGTWVHILSEEFFEALAEEDDARLRVELIQCAAVIKSWIRDIDERTEVSA